MLLLFVFRKCGQILHPRVHLCNQRIFLGALPTLQLFFSRDSRFDICKFFKIDQIYAVIFVRESAFHHMLFVFVHALFQIAGNAHIKHASAFVAHDVYKRFFTHFPPFLPPDVPRANLGVLHYTRRTTADTYAVFKLMNFLCIQNKCTIIMPMNENERGKPSVFLNLGEFWFYEKLFLFVVIT